MNHNYIPRCPEPGCNTDARRGKCLFELGSACPRHKVREEWQRLMKGKRSRNKM